MSDFTRLVRKELREIARPRHLIPLLVTPLILVLVAQGMAAVGDDVGEAPPIVVVDEDGDEYAEVAIEAMRESADVSVESVPPGAVGERLRNGDAIALIRIPAGFSERIASGERADLEVSTAVPGLSFSSLSDAKRIDRVLGAVDHSLALSITGADAAALDPTASVHTTYVQGTAVDGSPGALSSAYTMRFFFLSLVIVFAVFGAGQLVINSMGSEAENRTLETLLAMPVPRRTIVAAKLTSSAIVGLGLAVLYTGAIYVALPSGGTGSLPALGPLDMGLIALSLALAIVDILALALWLGAFADDSQGGQTLLLPIGFLTMAPAFITAFFDLASFGWPIQAVVYAIPSTHPVVAPTELLFGDTTVVLAGIAYEVVFAVVMIALAVRLFDSDRLVTGNAGRFGRLLETIQQ